MTSDVVLGSALRTNLLSLQRTQDGIDKVQNILATGLKVSSALDNPQNFFAAQSLNNRASDLSRLLDGIGQSISTIQAADKGASAIGDLIDQAESIAASAEEEAANGTTIAQVTGNVDLSGITDITSITGIAAADALTFGYYEKDGTTLREESVALSANDSIQEVLQKINDIGQATPTSTQYGQGEVFEASLTSDGFLQIESKTGGAFRLEFDGDGAADTTNTLDQGLGAALGFGSIGRNVASGGISTATNFEVTATASNKLVSGVFYESGGVANGFAESSDALTSVVTTLGGSTARFAFGENEADLVISVDGVSDVTISNSALSTATIQSFVDAINDQSDLIQAAYDTSTGELSIETLDSSVQSIQFEVQTPTTTTSAQTLDFDFGVKGSLVTDADASANNAGENYFLGVANDALADLESDYNTVRSQIDDLVEDAGYRGVNLLQGDELVTFFNEDRSNSLTTTGQSLSAASLGLSEANFASTTAISAARTEILSAKDSVRSFGNAIANSLSIVQTRESFTEDLIAELEAGAEKLTVADQNAEGARLLALQTRQQLGVTSLSLAVQSQQSVLRLF